MGCGHSDCSNFFNRTKFQCLSWVHHLSRGLHRSFLPSASGVDLADFGESEGEHPFNACARKLVNFDKPVVSAAKGVAVGGGATLLLHTDVVYVGESLRMRFPFTSLGLVPEWGSSYQLQAVIGARRAAELMYTSEWLDAG